MSLPTWAQVTPERRGDIERVVTLLGQWASAMQISAAERERWLKAGWLHDALRDAPLSGPFAHGPAAADLAAAAGETDEGVLSAVRHHTVGSADWDDVGRMLYLADFLEPGRDFGGPKASSDRAALADRVPTARDEVLREVARRRLEWVLRSGWPLPPATVSFWNQLAARR